MMKNGSQELKTEGGERKTFEQQLIKETERLYGEVERLKKENLRIQQASTNQSSNASNMERDIEILTKDRNDLLERVENLSKKLSEATREKKILEDKIQENMFNISTVQSNTELKQLRIKVMEKDEKIKDLIAENDKLRTETDVYEQKVSELIEKQQLIVQNTESGVFELEETIRNMNDELKQLKQNHGQKISDLETLLQHARSQLKIKEEESEDSDEKIKAISVVHSKELIKKQNELEQLKTTFTDFKKATKALGLKVDNDHKNEIQALSKSHNEKIKQLRLEFSQCHQSELENELSCIEENGRNIVSTLDHQTKQAAMLSDQDIKQGTSTKSNKKIQSSNGTTQGRKRGATRGRKRGGAGKDTCIPALSPIAEKSSIEDVEEGALLSKSFEIQTKTSEPPKKKTMQIKESEILQESNTPMQVSGANKKQIKPRKKQTKGDKENAPKVVKSVPPTRARRTGKKANTDISSENSAKIPKQQPFTSDEIEKNSKAAESFLKNEAAMSQCLDEAVKISTEKSTKKSKEPPNKQENRRRPLKQDPIENSIASKNQPKKRGSQKSKQDPTEDSIAKQEMNVRLPVAEVSLDTQSSSTRRLRKRK